ncbi:MAG: GNAT family N-acetyltransferase [Nostoc sp.]|uniref:GNAT family N-acetyltransferase n=1 Tax=Nostoc sp. TaxID=1180 RepID=UPI002FF8CD1D
MSRLQIRSDDLTGKKIADLLREHIENMHEMTPPGSVHALDLEALRSPDITFWTAWEGSELLGCGALKELDSRSGEVKSMRTAKAHRRRGVASKILEHIIKEAERRAYDRLYFGNRGNSRVRPSTSLIHTVWVRVPRPFC